MLTRALLAGIERSLALAIARDPLTARRLGGLAGKVILIQASEPDWQLYLLPDQAGISLLTHSDREPDREPDCRLSAPSSLLARLIVSDQRQRLLQDPRLSLAGDGQVLVSLQNILADLRLDGEAELARWLGPVAGHAIAGVLRDSWQWGEQSRQSLARSLGEYLTEEARHLVGNAEAQAGAEQLHELRLHLDRLEARIQRLASEPDTPDA